MSAASPEAVPANSPAVGRTVFLTLFIDLIGFSIIFPLYPLMLEHYLAVQGNTGALGALNHLVGAMQSFLGMGEGGTIILFGGILSALYSLLQFVCAPVLGTLSDRYGRRPILITSISGTATAYLIWVFAGSFEVLVLSRVAAGIMSGNISTASAAIADVTRQQERAKGMAIVGIAFGTGMVVGPALGGILSLWDPTDWAPWTAAWGINPFSLPALAAFLLAFGNILFVWLRFPETRDASRAPSAASRRVLNPLALFYSYGYPAITKTNIINLLYMTAFTGMEFSLTFLAVQRFGFGAGENAAMLVFLGLTMALVQGGYVRRVSGSIGPKRMAAQGLCFIAPGMALVGLAPNVWVLYAALLMVAIGAAQIFPCLASLVTIYTPPHDRGRTMGVFRSTGAMGRVVGPLLVCIIYWRLGSTGAYLIAAAAMVAPLMLLALLPPAVEPPEWSVPESEAA